MHAAIDTSQPSIVNWNKRSDVTIESVTFIFFFADFEDNLFVLHDSAVKHGVNHMIWLFTSICRVTKSIESFIDLWNVKLRGSTHFTASGLMYN